jgi:hypothetical protein
VCVYVCSVTVIVHAYQRTMSSIISVTGFFIKHINGSRKCNIVKLNGEKCSQEFKSTTSTTSLSYHINANHPTESKLLEAKKRKGIGTYDTVFYN